jgi:ESCRT-II complex subunit VPS25
MESMVSKNLACYEPPKQTRTALIYWRLPEEWAEVLHTWVHPCVPLIQYVSYSHNPQATSTGSLNTILTFYEITDPPLESPLTGMPVPLLKKAIAILSKTGRAQLIGIAEGEGVRFFPGGR